MSNIQIFQEDIQPIKIKRKYLIGKIEKLVLNEQKEVGDISVIFCSDNYLLKINKEFLNHDYYTDIVTFDYVENSIISGDLFISIDRIKENAQVYKTEEVMELFRVVFHGVLHLIGYNDKTADEKKEMKKKEDYYLSEVDLSELFL